MGGAVRRNHDRASRTPALPSEVDVLSDVLRSIQLTGAMLFIVDASAPWMSWAPETEAFRRVVLPGSPYLVSYHVVTRGGCWAGLRGGPAQRLDAGDVIVIPHGAAYYLCDPHDAAPEYQARDAVAFFAAMAAGRLPTVVTAGRDGARRAEFMCGFLGCAAPPFNPLLAALPGLIHLRAAVRRGDRLRHLIAFARAELRGGGRGAHTVIVRLAELLFVEIIRRYLAEGPPAPVSWLAGLRDPIVSQALGCLHAAPSRRWTLPALAAACATSRTVVAGRFTAAVGAPPMLYLARWRMQLAMEQLARPGSKVADVAHAVGYESEAAFSRHFKRLAGVSPAAWRRSAARAGSPRTGSGARE